MANIHDYLHWRGDLTTAQAPFNEVDALILAKLAYIPFEEIRLRRGSLPIAIGNAHGNYVAKPNLAFDRLRELRAALDLPLVLHGGSGIPDDQFGRCAAEGMSKFNIFTEYNMTLSNAMKASLDRQNKGGLQVLCDCKEACKELVRHKIRIVNPKGLRVV